MLTKLTPYTFIDLDDIYLVRKDIHDHELMIYLKQMPSYAIIIDAAYSDEALDIISKYADELKGNMTNERTEYTQNDESASQNFLEKFEQGTESRL